jgi:hypothetical protein
MEAPSTERESALITHFAAMPQRLAISLLEMSSVQPKLSVDTFLRDFLRTLGHTYRLTRSLANTMLGFVNRLLYLS